MTTTPTSLDPKIEVHVTPAGKLAIKATTSDGLTKTHYTTGGYGFYVISAKRLDHKYDRGSGEFTRLEHVVINIRKRTKDAKIAARISRNVGGIVFARNADGGYDEVSL